ncbi:hypothetical protein STENM223S_06491 [Streptomyces tendae]
MSQNGGGAAAWVVGGSVAMVLMPVIMMVAVSGGTSAAGGGAGTGVGGGLKGGAVPEQYVPWVLKAGALCDVIKPAVVAAQIEAESGWNPNAVSPVGAEGLSGVHARHVEDVGPRRRRQRPRVALRPRRRDHGAGRYDCALANR